MTLAPPERLLALLVRSPGGVTRVEVEGVLEHDPDATAGILVQRGHPLTATQAGWRLECAPLHFDPELFETFRRGALGGPLEVHEAIDSTNDRARAAALDGAPSGATWLAEHQTHGRGRHGRTWQCAPHAGLLASVLVDAPDTRAPATWLPLAVGLGACEALRRATGCDIRPKWPNDLWIGDRKLAGILVEVVAGAPRVVIGFGVNVRRGADTTRMGVALEEGGELPPREALLAALLAGIEERLAAWRRDPVARLRADYEALEITLGRRVTARVGEETLRGRAVGLTDAGLLRLETPSGHVRELAAGDVHLL
jgi:BirA family transcriptional regulator, biotin operon repressor / biotin---[acetyl-CoA-carboxylase] ligase